VRDHEDELEANPVTDEELEALALAGDVDAPLDGGAVSIFEVLERSPVGPLPSWYSPAVMGVRRLHGWRGRVVVCSALSVIVSFITITAAGLCNTYGQLHL
jgi:hypothetical protein